LGNIIYKQKEDFAKAETLVRELLRIRTSLYDAYHKQVSISASLLGTILQSQGNLGSETKELHELNLVSETRNCGPEGINTSISNSNLGTLCLKGTEHLETLLSTI
jgi:hypothetical protein